MSRDSDDDHELTSPSGPQWQVFERDIAELLGRLDRGTAVRHDVRVSGLVSGRERQIDVLVSGRIADQDIKIAVECKRYSKRLGIGAIDEFVGKLLDLRVDRGVLYALNGFSVGAWSRAEGAFHPRVVLRDLSGERPTVKPWSGNLFELLAGQCANQNCYFGDVEWREWNQDDGSVLRGGICQNCGTWNVMCRTCEEVNGFFMDELECSSCEERYQIVWDHDFVEVDQLLTLGPDVGHVVEEDPSR